MQLIIWPDRGIIRETLPECFKPDYTINIESQQPTLTI